MKGQRFEGVKRGTDELAVDDFITHFIGARDGDLVVLIVQCTCPKKSGNVNRIN